MHPFEILLDDLQFHWVMYFVIAFSRLTLLPLLFNFIHLITMECCWQALWPQASFNLLLLFFFGSGS